MQVSCTTSRGMSLAVIQAGGCNQSLLRRFCFKSLLFRLLFQLHLPRVCLLLVYSMCVNWGSHQLATNHPVDGWNQSQVYMSMRWERELGMLTYRGKWSTIHVSNLNRNAYWHSVYLVLIATVLKSTFVFPSATIACFGSMVLTAWLSCDVH